MASSTSRSARPARRNNKAAGSTTPLLWLAFALLCSVVFRRAATSALVSIAAWLLLTLFVNLLVGVVAGVISPVRDPNNLEQLIANDSTQRNLGFISPSQLFTESTQALLDPRLQTFDDLANFLLRNDPATRALPSTSSSPVISPGPAST